MTTTKAIHWADFVQLRPRYLRSVHLERDALERGWLEGYLVTPLVRSTLGRMIDGLRPEATARAWSVTGPYGAGKSAFALFLSQAMTVPELRDNTDARELLNRNDSDLAKRLEGRSGIFQPKDGLGRQEADLFDSLDCDA